MTNSIQQIIEREAERYLEHPYKDLYQDSVLISSVRKAVIHGANFALGLDRWIPVSQGLPEEGQEVYAVQDGKYQYSAIFTKGKFEFAQIEIGNVTHWTPQLPPPQK